MTLWPNTLSNILFDNNSIEYKTFLLNQMRRIRIKGLDVTDSEMTLGSIPAIRRVNMAES